MLAYSGQGRVAVEPLDISRVLREAAPLLEASIDKNVELIVDLPGGLPLVDLDPAQIQQLLIYVAVNGAEAMAPGGGRLTLSARAQEIDEAYVRNMKPERGELSPGRHVVIEVTDTGVGMDEATLARIFDPFFTTKFTGRGLGLAAAQGIVRAHKGAMAVESALGRGTTFRILLPVSAVAVSRGATPPAAARQVFRGTALVIDDEELVRSVAKDALERLGFSALTAPDGQEGIHLFRAASRSVRVVLLDMTMPGISAEETIRGIREVRSGVPILLCSGFNEAEAVRRFGAYGLAGFLQKPYTVDALSEKIGIALATGPSSESVASAQ
jgi:CheY-like chemotaxis protein